MQTCSMLYIELRSAPPKKQKQKTNKQKKQIEQDLVQFSDAFYG